MIVCTWHRMLQSPLLITAYYKKVKKSTLIHMQYSNSNPTHLKIKIKIQNNMKHQPTVKVSAIKGFSNYKKGS